MWLNKLGKAAYAAKTIYTFVFFTVLTWHVIRYQARTHKENK